MCGIAGELRWDKEPVSKSVLGRMGLLVAHRGPDGEGLWVDGPVGLAHRRLSIIDLSKKASQPMPNETGSVRLTYNGELYNYRDLRKSLQRAGHRFRSESDTEVIVHAYEEWGEACVNRFNGHFAFAIWDQAERSLFLARDRFGTKPLYYYADGQTFLFASEVKSILTHPDVSKGICLPALNEYFTFQNIYSDLTLFEGIHLLPPGHTLSVSLNGPRRPVEDCYWRYTVPGQPSTMSIDDATEELSRLFEQAVTRQLMSDVPLGCYLSGGMDSSSITAIARRKLGRLPTFTMGYDLSSASGLELGFDERAQSEALANLLKTEHYEMVLHAGDMEHTMPELIWHLEDLRVGQCYPNYYVARLAGKFVKVVLSGTGGDELFGGYPWRYHGRKGAQTGTAFAESYYKTWERLVPDGDKKALLNDRTNRELAGHSTLEVFRNLLETAEMPLDDGRDHVNASLLFEYKTFLHGLLLVEDRVSMAHGLETRMPFLDNDLLDFAVALPVDYKVKNWKALTAGPDRAKVGEPQQKILKTGEGKWILRQAMDGLIPPDVTTRVKQGFSAPDASWFRGESVDYISKLLLNPKAHIYEFLNRDYVFDRLHEHTSGHVNHRLLIWSLLSFEWWNRIFLHDQSPSEPANLYGA